MNKISKESEYKDRIIDKKVESYLKTFGAVCIEGPKWCGKTWTSSHHTKSEFLLADPRKWISEQTASLDVSIYRSRGRKNKTSR